MTKPDGGPTIVALAPVHADLAAEIHRTSFTESWNGDSIQQLLAMPGAEGLLAIAGQTPAGMILFRTAADEAEILTLAVVPEERRSGIASSLVDAALRRSWQNGARTAYLEVADDNLAAKSLYAAAGFERVGRRPDYYRTATGSAVAEIFRLDLSGRADRPAKALSE